MTQNVQRKSFKRSPSHAVTVHKTLYFTDFPQTLCGYIFTKYGVGASRGPMAVQLCQFWLSTQEFWFGMMRSNFAISHWPLALGDQTGRH